MLGNLAFYVFSPTCFINSIKHEHSCKILYISMLKTVYPFLSSLLNVDFSNMTILYLFQDPVKDGERKIKQDFDELYEEMQTGFRNLED